jgi:hypothetical protein
MIAARVVKGTVETIDERDANAVYLDVQIWRLQFLLCLGWAR